MIGLNSGKKFRKNLIRAPLKINSINFDIGEIPSDEILPLKKKLVQGECKVEERKV